MPPTPNPATPPVITNCQQCTRTFARGHFLVLRMDPAGVETGRIGVCSLICLIQWSYNFGVQTGLRGVVSAKGLFDRIVAHLKG